MILIGTINMGTGGCQDSRYKRKIISPELTSFLIAGKMYPYARNRKLLKTNQVSPEWLRSNIMLLEECNNIHKIGSY